MTTIDLSTLGADELRALIVAAQQALAALAATDNAPRRVTANFGPYNPRRYGQPWLAVVTAWPVGGKADLAFGRYLGTPSGGEAEVMARVGDIVRWGQRDGRGGNTEAAWGVVKADGSIERLTPAEARAAYRG